MHHRSLAGAAIYLVYLVYLVFVVLAMSAGCSGGNAESTFTDAPRDEAPFLAIKRTTAASGAAGNAFYLAVHKNALGERWFLTAFLKQMFPGAAVKGAAAARGIRVVTFRVREGRLFMFGASDNYASAGTFDPTLVVDSYPILSKDSTAEALNLRDHYVLIDPAGRSE